MMNKVMKYSKRLFVLSGLKLERIYGIYITFFLFPLWLLLVFRMSIPFSSEIKVMIEISPLDILLYVSAIFGFIIPAKWFILSAQKIQTILQEIDNIRMGKGRFSAPESPALLLVPVIVALVTGMPSYPPINTHASKVFESVYDLGYVFLLLASVNGVLLNIVASKKDDRNLGSAIVMGVAIWALLLELGKRIMLSLIMLAL